MRLFYYLQINRDAVEMVTGIAKAHTVLASLARYPVSLLKATTDAAIKWKTSKIFQTLAK